MKPFAILSAPLAAAAMLALAAPSTAQTVPEGGVTPQEVSAWLTGFELAPALNTDEAGASFIQVELDNLAWTISFYECLDGRCLELQYTAGFSNETITAEMVNRWNLERRFLKAYYLADGPTAVVQYDDAVRPGEDIGQLGEGLARWAGMLPDFAEHVGYFAPSEEGAQ